MKFYIIMNNNLFILFYSLVVFTCNAQWISLGKIPSEYETFDMIFKDENTGYVSGGNYGTGPENPYDAFLYKTLDGGITWSTIYSSSNTPIQNIELIGNDTMIFSSPSLGIQVSTNGGIDFYKADFLSNSVSGGDDFQLLSDNSLIVFFPAQSDKNRIINLSTDLGKTSQILSVPQNETQYYNPFFIDTLTGFISTGSTIYITRDGTNSWQEFPTPIYGNTFWVNKNIGFVKGTNSLIRTLDGGLSWDTLFNHKIFDINYQKEQLICFDENLIYLSSDFGNTWESIAPPSSILSFGTKLALADVSEKLLYIIYPNNDIYRYGMFNDKKIVTGNVYGDINQNCIKDSIEYGLEGIKVFCVTNGNLSATRTNDEGQYNLYIDKNQSELTIQFQLNSDQEKYLTLLCSPNIILNDIQEKDSVRVNDLGILIENCNSLNLEINSDRKRRCFPNKNYIVCQNLGVSQAVELKLTFPEYIVPLYSPTHTGQYTDSTAFFDLGKLNPGQKVKVVLVDSVVCRNESILGLTQCIKAEANVTTSCFEKISEWDGSIIDVEIDCVKGDSNGQFMTDSCYAQFDILNTGKGDMSNQSELRVYLDAELAYTESIQLKSEEKKSLGLHTRGKSAYVEIDQSTDISFLDLSNAFIENCCVAPGNTPSVGHIAKFKEITTNERYKSMVCKEIIGSYDPNDKQVFPVGKTDDFFVPLYSDLTYFIRFQNTGSDTAFNITVVDSLSDFLDPMSITNIISSHNFQLNLSNNVAEFVFSNILLPDKSTDELESHGFIKFKISPCKTCGEGTIIENKAYIYFDFNSPIITNRTISHLSDTILNYSGEIEPFIVTSLPNQTAEHIKVYPTQVFGKLYLDVGKKQINSLKIIDLFGHIITSNFLLKGDIIEIDLSEKPTGLYFIHAEIGGDLFVQKFLITNH